MRITLALFLVFSLSNRLMAEFAVEEKPDRVVVSEAGNPVATYVFRDETIRSVVHRDPHRQQHSPPRDYKDTGETRNASRPNKYPSARLIIFVASTNL